MKIMINLSNLNSGGSMYLSLSFIKELNIIDKKNDFYIISSRIIYEELQKLSLNNNIKVFRIKTKLNSIFNKFAISKELNNFEKKISPDLVFSLFGPTYWKPKTIHIMGFASAWLLRPDKYVYENFNKIEKIFKKIESMIKSYYLKNDAQYYITQTKDSKKNFCDLYGVEDSNVFVVGNTYDSILDNNILNDNLLLEPKHLNEYRFLTIGHYYKHKNLELMLKLIPYLENQQFKYKFYITIEEEKYIKKFKKYKKNIINLGPVSIQNIKTIYNECDAIFFPSLLETFTSVYPEAMKMRKPILTSNLSFATDICEDAALYFDPLDSKDIADKIIELSENKELQNTLIEKGKERLKTFETAKSRAEKYLDICETIIKKENKK